MRGLGIALVLVALAASPAAHAQTMAERQACKDDFQKLCPGVKQGGGRVIACLSKQKDALTPECRKVVDAHSK